MNISIFFVENAQIDARQRCNLGSLVIIRINMIQYFIHSIQSREIDEKIELALSKLLLFEKNLKEFTCTLTL